MSSSPSSPEDHIVILDFGSQYTQVIARRVRECRVYSEILPFRTKAAVLRASRPKGIILSGGPASVYAKGAPKVDKAIYDLGIPILGICYGMQLVSRDLGGNVERSERREYGAGRLKVDRRSDLFHGLPAELEVWNSHGDKVTKMPKGFRALGTTENSPHAVIGDTKREIYGLQFHPEVTYSTICRWTTRGAARMNAVGAQPRHEHLEAWHYYDAQIARWIDSFLHRWIGHGEGALVKKPAREPMMAV